MVSLLKIRGMLDQLSVIERKLAEFILDNAHMLRDYSSQQLADAVGISQSSVVKFCQKLGYKGYPDLKLAINEAVITASALKENNIGRDELATDLTMLAEQLQFSLLSHLRTLLDINSERTLQKTARCLFQADKILLAGQGESAAILTDLQHKLVDAGKLAIYHADPVFTLQLASTLSSDSVLLLISPSGENPELLQLARFAKQQKIKTISLTSYQTNTLNTMADISLFIVSGDKNVRFNSVLFQMTQQYLCHLLYLMLCQIQQDGHLFSDTISPQLKLHNN